MWVSGDWQPHKPGCLVGDQQVGLKVRIGYVIATHDLQCGTICKTAALGAGLGCVVRGGSSSCQHRPQAGHIRAKACTALPRQCCGSPSETLVVSFRDG